ncbi:YdcF family protein [Aliirhizobium terrae]|uniref:YdcF family protein n=1 Tax=Terrirhizobium terrae TaxID=2926709 RepID=UPI002575924B|nr:YdcF family protein [Rhizobium sp. CC-CFT758]WJH41758.1 YdcF family protein [Rhizobium sp. CC-CFT758]
MFLISKLIWLVAQPLSIAFLFAALAALLGLLGFRKLGDLSALISALVLFVTLYTTIGSLALQHLEDRTAKPADPEALSCMIVLGGVFESEVTTARGGIEFNQAADRFVEALRLALKYPQSRILISGGDGSFSGVYEGEAQASERFFTAFGVPSYRMVKDNTSRTTFENTVNTTQLLEAAGLNNCALITSAFHMPRSVALFKKAGISVTPWPVDFRTSGKVTLGLDFTQPSLNAQLTATAVREWMALIGYRIAGRIDGF